MGLCLMQLLANPLHAFYRIFLLSYMQLTRSAGQKVIQETFKKLSVLMHPDKCRLPNASVAFMKMRKAYDTLLRHATIAKRAQVDVVLSTSK